VEVRGVDFVMFPVSDLDRSIGFYRDTLGMNLEFRHGDMWVEFTATPTTLALYKPESPEDASTSGGAAIALAVGDVHSAIAELEDKGILVAIKPFESPVCYFAVVKDPDGNSVILHQRKDGTVG
jgi:catechol 2,3-dioxygenase-like lactoylglutathione lyase family enzyme